MLTNGRPCVPVHSWLDPAVSLTKLVEENMEELPFGYIRGRFHAGSVRTSFSRTVCNSQIA